MRDFIEASEEEVDDINKRDMFYEKGVYRSLGSLYLLNGILAFERCKGTTRFPIHAQVAHIMATIAAEAFFDELTNALGMLKKIQKGERLASVGAILRCLEDSRTQIGDKYVIASYLLPGAKYRRGAAPYQSFNILVKLRNSLVHPKNELAPPKWVDFFVEHGLTQEPGEMEDRLRDWRLQLLNGESARWSCQTVSLIIWDMIERLNKPASQEGVPGVYQSLKTSWEQLIKDPRLWPGGFVEPR